MIVTVRIYVLSSFSFLIIRYFYGLLLCLEQMIIQVLPWPEVQSSPPCGSAGNLQPIQVELSWTWTYLMSGHHDGPIEWLFCHKPNHESEWNCSLDNARASPVSDAHRPLPTSVRNWQGLMIQGQNQLKKLAQNQTQIQNLHIAMLNFCTMTGQEHSLMDMLMRIKVDIVCIQETWWKGLWVVTLEKDTDWSTVVWPIRKV